MRIIRELTSMSAGTYVERARNWSRVLEDKEAARAGLPLKKARPRVARRAGIAAGTLENLRNGRLKAVAVHVYERLRHAVEQELVAEMRRLEHELGLIRQTGVDPRSPEAQALLADVTLARRALGLDRPSSGREGGL